MAQPLLISPVTLRSVTLRNRIVISPLCQYSAAEGMANDWHFAHLAPAIQLAHAGRKASMQRPWHGNGPLDDSDRARGEEVWRIVAPSALAMDAGWLTPAALTIQEMAALREDFRRAALRAAAAGFAVL